MPAARRNDVRAGVLHARIRLTRPRSPLRRWPGLGIEKLPRQLPLLSQMLADLGSPRPAALARALGVSERTAWRWVAADDAPRSALLALYWLTAWGWSEVVSDAQQTITLARGMADCLGRELTAARAEIARLRAIGYYGSANDPGAWPIVQPRAGGIRPALVGSVIERRAPIGPELGFEPDQARFDAHDPSQVGT